MCKPGAGRTFLPNTLQTINKWGEQTLTPRKNNNERRYSRYSAASKSTSGMASQPCPTEANS